MLRRMVFLFIDVDIQSLLGGGDYVLEVEDVVLYRLELLPLFLCERDDLVNFDVGLLDAFVDPLNGLVDQLDELVSIHYDFLGLFNFLLEEVLLEILVSLLQLDKALLVLCNLLLE